MSTWNDADPPALPAPGRAARLRGGLRVAALVAFTLVSLVLFVIGRWLRIGLGRWVTFHFGVARLWSRGCLRLLGLGRVVHGRPIGKGAMVANHSSWIDIMALRACRLIYFVSKDDVARWPGVGFIARVTGTVFIARRRTEAKRQEQVLLERIAANQVLAFFPEGTSTDGLRVLPFKSSLFSAFFHDGHGEDLLIQPVTIRYHPAPGLPDAFYGWWGEMGFGSHIWAVCCHSRGSTVEVIFHPAVRPRDFADRKALAAHAERAVAEGHAAAGRHAPPCHGTAERG